jgi:hypothetical protein
MTRHMALSWLNNQNLDVVVILPERGKWGGVDGI